MKKNISKLALKTDKIVSLSKSQAMQLIGGAANWGSVTCGNSCRCSISCGC